MVDDYPVVCEALRLLLKGNGFAEITPELWPLLLFLAVAMTVGVKRYRQTLD